MDRGYQLRESGKAAHCIYINTASINRTIQTIRPSRPNVQRRTLRLNYRDADLSKARNIHTGRQSPYGLISHVDPRQVSHVGCTLPKASTHAMIAASRQGDKVLHRPGSVMLHRPTASPGSTANSLDVAVIRPVRVVPKKISRKPDIDGRTAKSVKAAMALVAFMNRLPASGTSDTVQIVFGFCPGTSEKPAALGRPPNVKI